MISERLYKEGMFSFKLVELCECVLLTNLASNQRFLAQKPTTTKKLLYRTILTYFNI